MEANWRPSAPKPLARDYVALAYDVARERVVLFGGYDGSEPPLADTWEWDGSTWKQRNPAQSPPGRIDHALAYDEARKRVVLFGGNGSVSVADTLGDTWEWDGIRWTQQFPATSPPARSGHALVYDSARGHVILFGGVSARGDYPADTWEWDGVTWTQRTPATSPPGRFGAALAYDAARGRAVLFGGIHLSSRLADTWEWDGVNWTQANPGVSPPARLYHALAYDAAKERVVLFGGDEGHSIGDTWEWDGVDWIQRTPTTSPPVRRSHALAYDVARGRVVLFGGDNNSIVLYSDTWEWDGVIWTERTPTASPPPRIGHALAYDAARGRVVLFGGVSASGTSSSDTWEWDGATWVQGRPATSPPPRTDTALAYDAARERVVLFGGTCCADTWEWDGDNWTKKTPATSPPGRFRHAMAYDAARRRVVLFGGQGSSAGNDLGDTWEWDGVTWTQRTPTASPPPRIGHALAYDAARGRMVLFGGLGLGPYLADTWEWDGVTWTQRSPVTSPQGRRFHSLAFDSARGHLVLFGGMGPGVWLGDTWEYFVPVPPRAVITSPSVVECDQPGGGTVLLDGTQSEDAPDGGGLIDYEWLRDPGLPTEQLIGTGATLRVVLGLGTTEIGLRVRDAAGQQGVMTTLIKVVDTIPPSLALTLSSTLLWPPNHRMVPVQAAWQINDACDPTAGAILVSATSSEPDDALGTGDGNTTGDIQDASIGTPDTSVLLRSERSGDGPGRVYTLTYAARDASGNTASALGIVTVPLDEGTGPEPVLISMEGDGTPGMAHLYWNAVSGAEMYDVIQGDLSQVSVANGEISLGQVHVLASGQTGASYSEGPSGAIPAVGSAFFYLVQYREGQSASGWGTESSPWPAEPSSCDIGCPGEPVAPSVASITIKRK